MPLKIIDSTNNNLEAKIGEIANGMIRKARITSLDNRDVVIKVCVDYCEDIRQKTGRPKNVLFDLLMSEESGCIISNFQRTPPEFYIFLQSRIFDNSNGTSVVVHEVAHLINGLHYYKQYYGNGKKSRHTYSRAFGFWTEFYATRKEMLNEKKVLLKKGQKARLDKVANHLVEKIKALRFPSSKLYSLAGYYAVLSVNDKYEPRDFGDHTFPREYLAKEFFDESLSLYSLISKSHSYTGFNKYKIKIEEIIKNFEHNYF